MREKRTESLSVGPPGTPSLIPGLMFCVRFKNYADFGVKE